MAKSVTTVQVLQFELTRQRGQVIRGAEELLEEVATFLQRLKASETVPVTGYLNINTFARVLTDYSTTQATAAALKIAQDNETVQDSKTE
jgi:hypothetical protein